MPDSPESLFIHYLDFDLEIGQGSFPEYPLRVLHSPAGESQGTLRLPFDQAGLDQKLQELQIALLRSAISHRQALSQSEQIAQSFGGQLFEALFQEEIRIQYEESLHTAYRQGKGLRLKLHIQPPELATLPWEFLYDQNQSEFVCLMRESPLVRYIDLPQRVSPLEIMPPLAILCMVSSPDDLPALDIEHEKQRIESSLSGLIAQGLVKLTWLEGCTWRDLQRAMRGGPWHVFHFIGHGGFDKQTDEGVLALVDEQGQTQPLRATDLARLLGDHPSLRLVFLNACEGGRGSSYDIFSSSASILVRRGLPAVLAMQNAISDRASIEFSRAFFEAVADGLPVDAAVSEGRKATSLAVGHTLEWATPVLYLRAQDGLLFHLPPTPSQQRRTGSRPAPSDREVARILDPLYAQGLNALWEKDWRTAIDCFQQIVDFHPGYLNATNKLEEAFSQLKIAQQRDTLQLAPEQPTAQVTIQPLPTGKSTLKPLGLRRWMYWLAGALAFLILGTIGMLVIPGIVAEQRDYDTFSTPAYENTYDPSRWNPIRDAPDQIFQTDGRLHMLKQGKSSAHSTSLISNQYYEYVYNHTIDFQARMRLNEQTTNGSIEMQLWFYDTNQGITCMILDMGSYEQTGCLFYDNSANVYQDFQNTISPNQWHTFSVSLNPTMKSFTFAFDDARSDPHYLNDDTIFHSKVTLVILVYGVGSTDEDWVHGEFDWVRVEEK
jgi:hypothetical protein